MNRLNKNLHIGADRFFFPVDIGRYYYYEVSKISEKNYKI
jgi:hypothetical protein